MLQSYTLITLPGILVFPNTTVFSHLKDCIYIPMNSLEGTHEHLSCSRFTEYLLGVYVALAVQGKAKIVLTAMPSFWQEHYNKSFGNFKFSELADVVVGQAGLFFFSEFDFKRFAFKEIQ